MDADLPQSNLPTQLHPQTKTDITDKETSDEAISQGDLSMLTLDRIDHTVAIFDQIFEEFAGPLQLHFITLEGLPEARTVQIAIAEL